MLKNYKVIGTLAFVLAGLFIGIFQPFTGLASQGHATLGVLFVALGLWIFRPGGVPFAAGSTAVIAGCLIFGLKYDVVVSGFVSPAVWVLIPALYFGFVLQKTGLGKRIAYLVLKSFEPSWLSMAFSWFLIGMALSALTPSIVVRIAIVMPIAIGVVEACKLEPGSRGAAFITIIAWAMCLFPGTGWLTGSLTGPIILGFLPAELKPMATFDAWFKILALPWFIITVVFTFLIYITMRPKQPIGIPKDTFKKQYAALGPVTRQETIAAILLVGSMVMFTTERFHHIPTAAVALSAFFLLIMFRVITVPEISTGVNWDVIIFFGVAISLSSIFVNAKVSGWLAQIIQPTLISWAPNPLTFLIFATIGILLVRFIDVPWGFSTVALTVTVLVPIFNQFGIHPLVSAMAYIIGINFFLLEYQQPFILMAEGVMQGRGWSLGHVTMAGVAYIIAAFVALLACMPYWRMIGAIH
ncbi:divalent anion:Na+ symporter, DASS-family transporter (putative sodium:sulfate symporter) [Syntrophobacter sp. SbD1]|nr:divalent anion:Na+ symporter, DASS-family transporter (putative sodium:sulfate symporter) [Syntrophobacter sp. SbD1]